MEKLHLTVVICAVFMAAIATPLVHGIAQGPEAVEEWFQKLPNAKEKTTKLHFYFHDTPTAENPTAVPVAEANITDKSPTKFGRIVIIDDALTVGPDPRSKEVGRAQGFYGSAAVDEVGFLMNVNFYFTSGNYKGSTLSLLGRNPIFHKYREMSIVGGSGVFRLARGIATAMTYFIDVATRNAIVEYNVIVLHYE